MAPLPPENTGRLWVDYSDGQHEHSQLIRFNPSEIGSEAALDLVVLVWEAFEPLLYEVSIIGARFADYQSIVSIPILWPGANTYGTDPMPVLLAPRESRFEGRGFDGRRMNISWYGGKYTSPDTYRILSAANATVLATQEAILDATVIGCYVTIGQGAANIKPYMNVNFNSYWERKARG